MGRVIRVTVSLPSDVAAFVGDLDTPPALDGQLLAEVITASTRWHIGPPYPAEDAAPVGVVLLLIPGVQLLRSHEGRRAAKLFDRASLYPLALLALVTVFVLID